MVVVISWLVGFHTLRWDFPTIKTEGVIVTHDIALSFYREGNVNSIYMKAP